MSVHAALQRLTLRDLKAKTQRGERLVMLTAYDATLAKILDATQEVDLLLVGDSLGNVVLGFDNTIPVTLDDMVRHTAAVVRGSRRALVVADLPFGTTTDAETALRASIRLFQETGCQAVKLEGGSEVAPIVRRLTQQGIPVMAHIGLTPQSVHQLGGYYRHGKSEEEVALLEKSARDLEQAGAFSIVLECVVPEAAERITRSVQIPTIGIGSGKVCNGEVLVTPDLVGLTQGPLPSFVTRRADVASVIRQAVQEFVADVKMPASREIPPPPKALTRGEVIQPAATLRRSSRLFRKKEG